MLTRQVQVILLHLQQLSGPRPAEPNDRELLRRYAASRDDEAFTFLVRRHGPMVLAVCQRMLGDGPDSEDAVQATFLVLARKAACVPWRESVAGWLHRVARHVAQRARTAAARRRAHEGRVAAAPPIDPLAEVSLREVQEMLDQELARLPDRFRTPLLLCCLHGVTRDEAARNLGWSLATLKRRLEHGRSLLRGALARRGLTLPAALTAVVIPALAPAILPARLAAATVETARGVALGQATGVSARVSDLAESALPALSQANWKAALAIVMVLGLVAGGAGIAACLAPADPPPAAKVENAPARLALAPATAKPAVEQPRTDFYGDPLPPGALARLGTRRMRAVGPHLWLLAFTPDGKTVISCGDYIICVHDAATRKLVKRSLLKFKCQVPRNGLSRDGKTLALLAADGIHFWDVATGTEERIVKMSLELHNTAALSADWQTLAMDDRDRVVRLLDAKTGKLLHRLKGHTDWVRSVAFSGDGKRIASGSQDRTARVWDTATGKLLHTLSGHELEVSAVDFSPDGDRLATAGRGRERGVHIFDLTSGKEVKRLIEVRPPKDGNDAETVRFSPRGDLLAIGNYQGPDLFDARTGKKLRSFGKFMGRPNPFAFSPDGKTLAAFGGDGTLSLGDVATGKELCPLTGHQGTVGAVVFSRDGKMAVTADWGTVRVWEPVTGKILREIPVKDGSWLTSLAFSPDGKLLAYGSCNGPRRLWDVATWKEYPGGDDSNSRACWVAFSPDGKKLATVEGYQPPVKLWDVATGKQIGQCAGHQDRAYAVVFSPDGQLVISVGEDKTVRIWKTATGEELRHFMAHKSRIECLALSPDGRILATGDWEGPVRLWDVATGKLRLELVGHPKDIKCLAFSPDGKILASGSCYAPGNLRLWQVASGKQLVSLQGHDWVTAVAFSRDGKRLVSGGADSMALVWDVTRLRAVKAAATAPLSDKELDDLWGQLAGDDAARAYQAIGRLAGAPDQALEFLSCRLAAARAPDARRIGRLLADLDSERFRVREQAETDLLALGDEAEPALRQILDKRPSLEVHRRVERILKTLERAIPSREVLRGIRCVEVLEQNGTMAARQVLKTLYRGSPGSRLTREAKAALQRLGQGDRDRH